jgi:hypothetical protein
MKLAAIPFVSMVLMLAGCTQAAAPSGSTADYESAMVNCVQMADEAMPNGMQDPNEPTNVLNSSEFCTLLAGGYSLEKFAELYNDPEWLANELEIWSDEGLPD